MHVVSGWWVPFKFQWVYDAGHSDFRIPALYIIQVLLLMWLYFEIAFWY